MGAGAVVFFAYIGFDAVSTTAEEAKNPKRDLPIGIISSLVICTILYIVVAAILSGIVPVTQYRSDVNGLPGTPVAERSAVSQFLNAPVGFALSVIHQDWAAGLVSAGAVAGITSVLLVMLMSQPRIFFSMSRDQLLPAGVSKVHPRFGTPYITTIITGVVVAVAAGLIPINVVGEMTSIGTLFAFVVVCAAVIMLRIKRPEAPRPFRVPLGYLFPILGVVSCLGLMAYLSVATWGRFLIWLNAGMMIYWFYGRTHSPLRDPVEQARQPAILKLGNFVTVLAALGLFNGAAIALQGLMTEWGMKSQELAKWHEITWTGLTSGRAVSFGFVLTALSLVVFFGGRLLGRTDK
jgi:basic amino acid/polyamine antiporter, APA family